MKRPFANLNVHSHLCCSLCGKQKCDCKPVMPQAAKEAAKVAIQPLHDRILIKLDLPKQEGLIVIPEAYREDPRTGEVLAVGPGRWRDDGFYRTSLRPGQRVLISPAVNMNYDDIVKQNGEVVVQEDDVMGVLVDD